MKNVFASSFIAMSVAFIMISCGKESENVQLPPMSDYFPLEVGKSYLYRLDSTVPFNFGERLVLSSYQAKDSIESTFTDNQGRLSYRIYRFLRDTSGLQPWQFNNTFFATPTKGLIEYVDNNFRFIKFHNPVKNGYTWPGNSFIETKINNTYLDGWEYEFMNVGEDFIGENKTYKNTVTVLQQDDLTPAGLIDFTLGYQQKNYSKEVYAKGIGLIYKDLLHWEWQRPQNQDGTYGKGKFADGAYGIRLSLISHN